MNVRKLSFISLLSLLLWTTSVSVSQAESWRFKATSFMYAAALASGSFSILDDYNGLLYSGVAVSTLLNTNQRKYISSNFNAFNGKIYTACASIYTSLAGWLGYGGECEPSSEFEPTTFDGAKETETLLTSDSHRRLKNLFLGEGDAMARLIDQKPRRILLLGEDNSHGSLSMSTVYGEKFRGMNTEIYKTGITCTDKGYNPDVNVYEQYLSHEGSFPFPDNYFDVILGQRIICNCNINEPYTTCGGIGVLFESQTKFFFNEVARVLNVNNDNCFACIQGVDHQRVHPVARLQANRNYNLALKAISSSHLFSYAKLSYIYKQLNNQPEPVLTRYSVIMGNEEFNRLR